MKRRGAGGGRENFDLRRTVDRFKLDELDADVIYLYICIWEITPSREKLFADSFHLMAKIILIRKWVDGDSHRCWCLHRQGSLCIFGVFDE